MRSGTMYWVGIRHVGDAAWQVEPRELPALEIAREVVRVIGDISLATRLEVVVARTEDEVMDRLMDRRLGASKDRISVSDFDWQELEAQLSRVGEGDS